eukprot:7812444-Lingulodinium_polyedra.AAC.1
MSVQGHFWDGGGYEARHSYCGFDHALQGPLALWLPYVGEPVPTRPWPPRAITTAISTTTVVRSFIGLCLAGPTS